MEYFDRARFERAIVRPDWYVFLHEDLRQLFLRIAEDRAHARAVKEALYGFFETALREDRVTLAKSGPNRDAERLPIECAILHHTGNRAGITAERLSAMQLLRLYAFSCLDFGQPIWSNHVRERGNQVFYAYHWLIRSNGQAERLLFDHEIGWHSGNWEWNRRSVSIALDGNHEHGNPPTAQLEGVATVLRTFYPQIGPDSIFGHCEVPRANGYTLCPGKSFRHGWKRKMLRLLLWS